MIKFLLLLFQCCDTEMHLLNIFNRLLWSTWYFYDYISVLLENLLQLPQLKIWWLFSIQS